MQKLLEEMKREKEHFAAEKQSLSDLMVRLHNSQSHWKCTACSYRTAAASPGRGGTWGRGYWWSWTFHHSWPKACSQASCNIYHNHVYITIAFQSKMFTLCTTAALDLGTRLSWPALVSHRTPPEQNIRSKWKKTEDWTSECLRVITWSSRSPLMLCHVIDCTQDIANEY